MSLLYSPETEEKSEDVVYEWQGYFGDINLNTFPVFHGKKILKVSVGDSHALFLTSEHHVYGYGKNDRGQVGIPDEEFYQQPQIIDSLSDKRVVEVACGVSHSGVITDDGDVYCWGDNSRTQCGLDTPDKINIPLIVPISETGEACEHGVTGDKKVVARQISCGAVHTLIICNEGNVWSWGQGAQLGQGSTVKSPKPCLLETLKGKNVIKICCGHSHSVALVARTERQPKKQKLENRHSTDVQISKYYPSRCSVCNTEIYTYTDNSDTCIIENYHVCKDDKVPVDRSVDSLGDDSFTSSATSDLKTSAISEGSGGSKITESTDSKIIEEDENAVSQNNSHTTDGDDAKEPNKAAATPETSDPPDATEICQNIDKPSANAENPNIPPATESKNLEPTDPESTDLEPTDLESTDSESKQGDVDPKPQEQIDSAQDASKSQSGVTATSVADTSMSSAGNSDSVNEKSSKDTIIPSKKCEAKTPEEILPKQEEDIWKKAPTPDRLPDINRESPSSPSKEETVKNPKKQTNDQEDGKTERSSFGGFFHGVMQNIGSAASKAITDIQNQIPYGANPNTGNGSITKSNSQDSNSPMSDRSPVSDQHNFVLTCGPLDSPRRGSRSKEQSPTKAWSPEKDRVSKKPQSIKTLMDRQEQMEKRASMSSPGKAVAASSIGSVEGSADEDNPVVIDTEVWVWGRNAKGQLGLGDSLDRDTPKCIKMMNGKEVVVIAAGHSHCVAATANSQVYTWGHNGYLQLGHNETTVTPCRVKFMKGCYVWDVAAGDSYSVFLADSSGMKPAVFYCGKHPYKDPTAPLKKIMNPTIIGPLKKCGWVRQVQARGDKCFCLVKPGDGVTATMFEFAASERGFYQQLNRIINAFIKPLQKSAFYTSLDVYPFKTCLQNLLQAFIDLSKKVGDGIAEVSEIMRENQCFFDARIMTHCSQFVKEFKNYSNLYADMLAVGGFDYCGKMGTSFFDQCKDIFPDLIADKSADKTQYSSAFRRTMEYPFIRVKLDYRRLFGKMAENLPQESDEKNLLNRVLLNWESLKMTMSTDHRIAEATRLFWESVHPKILDALRVPSKRLLRDSKTSPLMLPHAGRFSNHVIALFNDGFVHIQNTAYQHYPLSTLWVESHSSEAEQQNVIIVTSPEDTLTLVASTPEEKAEWLMTLNAAINKELCIQKAVSQRNSAERFTPPLIRHVIHTFTKHCLYKDATYKGFMLNGKMHGQGEMSWHDGRKYIGKFSQGLQQGHGQYIIPRSEGFEIQDGNWKDGKLNGYGIIKYENEDSYKGYFKDGQRFGHGIFKQGLHMSNAASIYIGEWYNDKRHGYGVQDDIMKGEKYMGMWQEDCCHGKGVVVTLDGMYFEGNFVYDKLTGFGLMLTDDNSCYEGEFQGVTLLQGKGSLTLPSGDKLDGVFNGTWNEGLKFNGTFIRAELSHSGPSKPKSHMLDINNRTYGKLSVPADSKWSDIFKHTLALLGYLESKNNPNKAWEVVAVKLTQGQKKIKELEKKSPTKAKTHTVSLESLQTIPPYNTGKLSIESYNNIAAYLSKAFDNPYHPLGSLVDGIVDVFRAAYVGVGAHPRLLHHAVQEIKSYVKRIYVVVRLLFPDLPVKTGPVNIYTETSDKTQGIPLSTEAAQAFLRRNSDDDEPSEIISAAGLLYPILLPKIYPPLSDLYGLYNDRDDNTYWERVTKLNRQGDMALMAFLGIDERFWLMKEVLLQDKSQKLSAARDQCYASAVDTLQQLSTAFSPIEKLRVIEKTFQEITETVQASLKDDHVWCMDDLFPIFQFVVVRAKIRHLGAEVHMIDDLMETHLEFGELGIMFTTLKACYFQIQNEKIQHH
ncbi:alsin isoform X1 [Patella vulgata]|uniref:alsin isoform X1 n=2 Tax=Patella vulgata TaxID=6465 RepID=UPI0024A7F126|nr:alsin isoform X1 [Patella vulgata]